MIGGPPKRRSCVRSRLSQLEQRVRRQGQRGTLRLLRRHRSRRAVRLQQARAYEPAAEAARRTEPRRAAGSPVKGQASRARSMQISPARTQEAATSSIVRPRIYGQP
jgi:hypothetical protein